ncbi:MAG: hypothetical protein K6L73_02725 [Cellvibrionaceae bacterium]
MDFSVEIVVALIALIIAIWQLALQRGEIRENGKISALIHMASIVKDKIEYHERIIEDKKELGEAWKGHAYRVNNDLRPLLKKINKELTDAMSGYGVSLDGSDVKELLKAKDE